MNTVASKHISLAVPFLPSHLIIFGELIPHGLQDIGQQIAASEVHDASFLQDRDIVTIHRIRSKAGPRVEPGEGTIGMRRREANVTRTRNVTLPVAGTVVSRSRRVDMDSESVCLSVCLCQCELSCCSVLQMH